MPQTTHKDEKLTPKQQALAQIKAVYEDKCATINGRNYKFGLINHESRVKVFAFYSSVESLLAAGRFDFLTTPEFKAVFELIGNLVTYDDNRLSVLEDHWDEYPEDYLKFVSVALGAISYPFFRGVNIS